MSRVYTIELKFPGDASFTDVTHLVLNQSVEINRQLFNSDRRSVVDTMSFSLKYDSAIAAKYYSANDRIQVTAAYADTSAAFTGVIDPVGSQTVSNRVGPMQFEAVDNSYLLDLPLQSSFEYPATVGDSPFAILNKSATASSIVHQLLSVQGYSSIVDSGCPDITDTVEHIAGTKDDESAREILDDLLSDYGYTFYFTKGGFFSVYQWDRDTVTESETITDKFCTSGFTIRKKDQVHDGVRLEWTELETMANALLYRENLPLSSTAGEVQFTGKPIANGDYFPPDSDIEDIYQDFKSRWLDRPYLNRETRMENNDLSLISTSNHTVSFTADTGVAIASSSFEAKRAKVSFQNTSGGTANIYTFDITGTALYRSAIRYVTATDSASNPKQVTSRFIFDSATALRSARARSRIVRFSDFTYEFALRDPVQIGDIIRIQQSDPSIDTVVVITSQIEVGHTNVEQYTAEALTEFSADAVLQAGGGQAGPAVQDTVNDAQTGASPTFADIDNGYTASSGGTVTPTQPTVVASPAQHGVVLRWDRQDNLTNFERYEVQVSDDAGSTWHSLEFGGDGKDAADPAVTNWYSELLVHAKLPLDGTADDPQDKTFHYRVRRRTKLGDVSAWSATVSADCLATGAGDIAANSISANQLQANVLNAQIANVNSALNIDSTEGYLAGNYSSPEYGNDKWSFTEKRLLRSNYLGEWVDSQRLGSVVGDRDGGAQFNGLLRARGGVQTPVYSQSSLSRAANGNTLADPVLVSRYGNRVVAFERRGSSGSNKSSYAQRSHDGGQTWSSPGNKFLPGSSATDAALLIVGENAGTPWLMFVVDPGERWYGDYTVVGDWTSTTGPNPTSSDDPVGVYFPGADVWILAWDDNFEHCNATGGSRFSYSGTWTGRRFSGAAAGPEYAAVLESNGDIHYIDSTNGIATNSSTGITGLLAKNALAFDDVTHEWYALTAVGDVYKATDITGAFAKVGSISAVAGTFTEIDAFGGNVMVWETGLYWIHWSVNGGRTWETDGVTPSSGTPSSQRIAATDTALVFWDDDSTTPVITSYTISGWETDPGGGIVEQGSNSNGNYVVFSSGLQVCWQDLDLGSTVITGAWGNIFISSEQSITSFPKAFGSAPIQTIAASGDTTGGALTAWVAMSRKTSATAWGAYFIARGTSNTIDIRVSKIAIGEAG